ncbi:MAG TPA: endonuclease MutS2, partial [Myxococcota bacterium]|nr:endonuclease MutS2 [Myxococcota bacterium]
MPFEVAQATLESLEWSRITDALRAVCRTPQGRLLLAESSGHDVFEADEGGVRARLRETDEARALVDRDTLPPLAGCIDLRAILARAAKGGVLEPAELLDVRSTLAA